MGRDKTRTEANWRPVEVPSHAENAELARRAQRGDRDARNEVIERNMPLVRSVAVAIAQRFKIDDIRDLQQEGVFGLVRAIEKFDPSLGVHFGTYATYWIRQAAGYYAQRDSIVRVPSHMRCKHAEGPRTEDGKKLWERLQRCAAAALDVGQMADEFDAAAPPEHDTVEHAEDVAVMRAAMDRLSARDREVIERRYGFGGERQTLKTIGEDMGVTREWIRKIELRSLDAMRKAMAV